MRKLKFIGVFFLIGMCFYCSDDDISQEQESQDLNEMFSEIKKLASNENCNDSSEWNFTNYGSKACGGPIGFIAYSKTIDTELFFIKIQEHRKAQQNFNKKWGIFSDCSIPSNPIGVLCKNGNPIFEY
jgi:hypothetical protein